MSISDVSAPESLSQPSPLAIAITLSAYDRPLPYTITRTQENLQITPAFEWQEEEGRFIAARLLTGKVPQSPLRLRPARNSIAAGFLKCLDQYRPHTISRRGQPIPHWPDEVALVVVAIIQIFGFDALRLNAADERVFRLDNRERKSSYASYLAILDNLGRIVNAILRDWNQQIDTEKNLTRRNQLISFVTQAFHSFIPPTQGKRSKRVVESDLEVKVRYARFLFRCELASALLKKIGTRSHPPSLQELCAATQLPGDPVQWGMKGRVNDPQFVMRNLQFQSAEYNAASLVASNFGVTVPAIQNIVSR